MSLWDPTGHSALPIDTNGRDKNRIEKKKKRAGVVKTILPCCGSPVDTYIPVLYTGGLG